MPSHSALFLSEKNKLERFCAYEDRCVFQIRKKLLTSLLPEAEKEMLITTLINDRFLDDFRFACSYVSGKSRIKKWGAHKIYRGLKSYQIKPDQISLAMKEIALDDYMNTLKELIERKKVLLSDTQDPYKKKVKIIRYLTGKGYSLTDIYRSGIEED
jgi:regulatory protein